MQKIICRTCDGRGTVTRSRSVGSGRTFGSKRKTSYDVQCKGCRGRGLANDKALLRHLKRVAENISTVSELDGETQSSLRFASESLFEVVKGQLASILNDDAVDCLTSTRTRRGEPVVFRGNVLLKRKLPNLEQRYVFLQIAGTSEIVLLLEPRLFEAAEGEAVICTGIFAGHMDIPDKGSVKDLPILYFGLVTNG